MIIEPIIPIWVMIIISIALAILSIRNKQHRIIKLVIVVLLFIINLRIMIPSENVKTMANNLDVLFVIDNTMSMVAEDYQGSKTRLSAVQKDCEHIIDELGGARYSIISFSNYSQIIAPYTRDANMIMEAINTFTPPHSYYATGSSLSTPLDDMETILKISQEKGARKRIVFFISDGEETSDEKIESFKGLKEYIDNGAVLGYGTTKGGKMKVSTGYDEKEYLEYLDEDSYSYETAISKIDEDNLKKIADDMNIEYIHMDKQSNIDSKLKDIKKLINSSYDEQKNAYIDIYYIFVIPVLGLLVYEFIYYKRKL